MEVSSSEEAKGSRSWQWSGKWDEKNYLLLLLHTFWSYCLLYYRRFPLLCIKRDAPCQLQINCHFHFLNFPTVSSLLHISKILVHWIFLEISGPKKWVVGPLWPSSRNFWLEHWTCGGENCPNNHTQMFFFFLYRTKNNVKLARTSHWKACSPNHLYYLSNNFMNFWLLVETVLTRIK